MTASRPNCQPLSEALLELPAQVNPWFRRMQAYEGTQQTAAKELPSEPTGS